MNHEPTDTQTDSFIPAFLAPRRDGWTADRQRKFLEALAETGCVTHAATTANITPRSAHRLRAHAKGAAFARAWDEALLVATGRLTSVAFERATVGALRHVWRDGKLVGEMRVPSDRLMMFLLQHLMPETFGPKMAMGHPGGGRTAEAHARLPGSLDALADVDMPAGILTQNDYFPEPPTAQAF